MILQLFAFIFTILDKSILNEKTMTKYLFLLLFGFLSFANATHNEPNQDNLNFGYIAKLKSDGSVDFIGNKNSILSNWNSNLNLGDQKLSSVEIVKEGKQYFLLAKGVTTETGMDHNVIKYTVISVMELVESEAYLYVSPTVCTQVSTDEYSKVRPKGNDCVTPLDESTVNAPQKRIAKDLAIVGIEINYKIIGDYYKKHKLNVEL